MCIGSSKKTELPVVDHELLEMRYGEKEIGMASCTVHECGSWIWMSKQAMMINRVRSMTSPSILMEVYEPRMRGKHDFICYAFAVLIKMTRITCFRLIFTPEYKASQPCSHCQNRIFENNACISTIFVSLFNSM